MTIQENFDGAERFDHANVSTNAEPRRKFSRAQAWANAALALVVYATLTSLCAAHEAGDGYGARAAKSDATMMGIVPGGAMPDRRGGDDRPPCLGNSAAEPIWSASGAVLGYSCAPRSQGG